MRGQPLFEKVVELSGVSAVLAPGLVRRSLLDGKVKVEDAGPADYRAALPRLLARLRAYMPEDEAQRRARRIAALLGQLEGGADAADEAGEGSLSERVSEALRTPAHGSVRSQSTPSGGEGGAAHAVFEFDEDDVTTMGRRYTLDELRRTGVVARDGSASAEDDEAGTGAGSSPPARSRST